MKLRLLRTGPGPALLLAAGLLAAPAAYADFILNFDTGRSELSHSAYDRATTTRLTGGYRLGPLSLTASAYEFNQFSLDGNRDAHYELDGASVQAGWRLGAGPVNIDLGGGLFDWDSKTRLDGRTFGRDSGTSAMLEAGVSTTFASVVGIYLNARRVEDLSGEDLTTLSGGVQ
jgi:hypothetical protein